jgi:hypothetical protein
MSKIIQITTFNNILEQFFDYMEDEFQYFKSDLILTRSIITTVRKSNPRLVVEQFLEYILPFEKYIVECDEDFFLNFENNMSLNKDNMMYGLKLKSIWLSNQNQSADKILRGKAVIFHFFGKLIKIAKLI